MWSNCRREKRARLDELLQYGHVNLTPRWLTIPFNSSLHTLNKKEGEKKKKKKKKEGFPFRNISACIINVGVVC